MSYFQRFVKSIYLWNKLNKYKTIKNDCTINFSKKKNSIKPKQSISFKRKHSSSNTLLQGCKSFLGGTFISWIVFGFGIWAFRMSFQKVTLISSILATFLCFGLAFSEIMRCYTLMLLPQLFSKRGRQALAAYAFILALSGPARNSLHNVGVLSSSYACAQEQVERLIRQVVNMVREPLLTLTDTLKSLVKDIKDVVQPVRDVVTRISQIFIAVCSVIENVFAWLGNIVKVCNKTTGTPFQRCIRSLNDAIADCQVKLGIMRFLCSIVSVVKQLCGTVKVVDTLCALVDVVSDAVVAKVKRRLAVFRQHVADMLSVSIEMKHSIDMNTTSSRSVKDVISSIVTEMEDKTENVRSLFNWVSLLPSIAFLFLFLKVWLYRHKFLTSDNFDNKYINRFIVEMDLLNIRRNQPTVLPLELHERFIYTTVGSVRLVKHEKRRVASAILFLLFTSIQIGSYLLSDMGIYWTLVLIRREAPNNQSGEMPSAGVQVEGGGALASLYLRLSQAFQPPSPQLNLQTMPCLPEASPPNTDCYIQIGMLLATSLLLAVTEPYGLRLRHVVMSHYYPARARQRAAWLHNHITLARGSFSLLARLQLSKRAAMSSGAPHISIWKTLTHRNRILLSIFSKKLSVCCVCASEENYKQKMYLTPCPALHCSARFCELCISELMHCIQCYEPLRGNVSLESSEARDSSDSDELPMDTYSEESVQLYESDTNESEN